jgi:predicted double-glycine peptidase/predicted  nucleic acid-binding Zn-ribbon protein
MLMLVSSASPALLYAEEAIAPVVEDVVSAVQSPEVTPVISAPVTDSPLIPALTPVPDQESSPVIAPVVAPMPVPAETPSPVVSEIPPTVVTAPVPVSAPAPDTTSPENSPSDTSISLESVTKTSTEVTEDETVTEEEEEEDFLDLGDDQAEMDALKDFTGVVRQSKPYTCWPAALATLRTQLGEDTAEEQVLENIQLSDISEEQWVTLLTLKNAAIALGSQVVLKKWTADDVLTYIQQTQDPVLIHDEKKDVGGHFSVIREYDAEKWIVELSDTEAGNIKYSVEDFRHIYTGYALVIYDGELSEILADVSTNVSDEIASAIWGKYVPVYMLAERSGNNAAIIAASAFKTCINNAMKIVSVSQRNIARNVCYTKLGESVSDGLSNIQELSMRVKSSLTESSTDHLSAVGTVTLISTLKTIFQQQNSIIVHQTRLTQLNTLTSGTTLTTLNTQLAPLKTKLDKAKIDKQMLDQSITSKQTAITNLTNEINNGFFVKDAQLFQLGAVWNQLNAQATTYKNLSAALSGKLSSIDSQIRGKQSQITSLTSQKSTADKAVTYNQWQADIWYSKLQAKIKAKKSSTNEQNQYNYYWNQANTERNRSASFQSQINTLNRDITNLNNQKTSANNEVTNASNEKARLERLKSFGDTEMQRKRNLLPTLNTELKSLQNQLPAKIKAIADLEPQVNAINVKIGYFNEITSIQSTVRSIESQIFSSSAKYGYTSITSTNTAETQKFIDAELAFERGQDQSALKGATDDLQATVDVYAQIVVDSTFFQIPNGIVMATIQDGKQCVMNGWIQACLSTCGMTLDYTAIWAPVAMLCDAANGTAYLFQGEFVQAWSNLLAVVPVIGNLAKTWTKTTLKLTDDAASVIKKKVPDYIISKRVPLDTETFLKNSDFQKTNYIQDGAAIYKDSSWKYYHRDTFHKGESAHIEVYNKLWSHIWVANPITWYINLSSAVPGRTINIK